MMEFQAVIKVGRNNMKVLFTDGSMNAMGVNPAKFTTTNYMVQHAIENSPEFKRGLIKRISVIDLDENVQIERYTQPAAPAPAPTPAPGSDNAPTAEPATEQTAEAESEDADADAESEIADAPEAEQEDTEAGKHPKPRQTCLALRWSSPSTMMPRTTLSRTTAQSVASCAHVPTSLLSPRLTT